MKRLLAWAATCVAIIGAMLVVLVLAFPDDGTRRAAVSAALVALPVQVVGFAVARAMGKDNVIVGWGIGVLLRFGAVLAFAVAAPVLGVPRGAALLSLVAFLFVSTLVEPLFLKP